MRLETQVEVFGRFTSFQFATSSSTKLASLLPPKLFVASEVPVFQVFSGDLSNGAKQISDHMHNVMDDLVTILLSFFSACSPFVFYYVYSDRVSQTMYLVAVSYSQAKKRSSRLHELALG